MERPCQTSSLSFFVQALLLLLLLLTSPGPQASALPCSVRSKDAKCGCSDVGKLSSPSDNVGSLADDATGEDSEYYYIDDMAFRKQSATTSNDEATLADPSLNPSFWPGGIIFYILDDGFSDAYRKQILAAMDAIQTRVGTEHLEFREARLKPGGDICRPTYLHVIKADTNKCVSEVGMQLTGLTRLWLNQQFCSEGTIQHELLHSLGRYHEHCRPDRNQHVVLMPKNMINTRCSNFNYFTHYGLKSDPTLKSAYDTDSIMHYGSCYFTCNGGYTMLRKDGTEIEPNRERMTDLDVEKVRLMFPISTRTQFDRSFMQCSDAEGTEKTKVAAQSVIRIAPCGALILSLALLALRVNLSM